MAFSIHAQSPDLYDLGTVRDVYLSFNQSNWWQQLENNYSSRTNIEATMVVDSKTYYRVGVRFRGNTSYRMLPPGSQKKSFNIELDWQVPGQDLYGYDSLNLNNGFHDPTFCREVITYQIMRRYGLAPKANFVRLHLNNQYWGIYINVQQPDAEMMDEWFRTDDGNRYRGFPSQGGGNFNNTALTWLGWLIAPYQAAYQFKKGDGTDLVKMIDVLNNTAINNLYTELPKVFSVDQAFWYCIVMNVLLQTDSYIGSGKDHFSYHDTVHDQFHLFPFDVNESLGGEGRDGPNTSPYYGSTNSRRPVLYRTFQVPRWKARYIAHYRTVLEESFSWTEIGGLIAKYQKMIATDVANDPKKIYTTAQFTQNVTQDVRIGRTVIKGIKPLVEARETYLEALSDFQTTRPTLSDLSHAPAAPKHTETVHVTVKASNAAGVTLYSRAIGPFLESPMFDDGQHGDGAANDGVYGAAIAPQAPGVVVEYHVGATTSAGVMRFLPKSAEFQAPSYQVAWKLGTSPIRITEFLAKNDNGIRDEMGDREDWIELTNTGTTPFDISGHYLSDKTDNPSKWTFPATASVQPGHTVLVWADEDAGDGPLHANFKLNATGESIYFFDKDAETVLDSVAFGAQSPDVSTGRQAEHPSIWATFPAPTPRASNRPEPCGHLAYGPLDAAGAALTLTGTGSPTLGNTVSYEVAKAPASSPGYFALALSPLQAPLGSLGALLVNPVGMVLLPLMTNPTGTAAQKLLIPNVPGLGGLSFYLQAFVHDGKAGGFANGVITRICL
jgi:hypothetical protein